MNSTYNKHDLIWKLTNNLNEAIQFSSDMVNWVTELITEQKKLQYQNIIKDFMLLVLAILLVVNVKNIWIHSIVTIIMFYVIIENILSIMNIQRRIDHERRRFNPERDKKST